MMRVLLPPNYFTQVDKEKTMKISDIEGIGPVYAAKLAKVGIRSAEGLLKNGASDKGRKEITKATGITPTSILDWVNRADLYRIRGIGRQYSDLLEKAGVDTVVELSNLVAEKLYIKMVEVNKTKNLVNAMPGIRKVKKWIVQAKKLPKVVTN
jgi:predicted flap endonuclease-1-like 5' DNA nuclease